MTVDISLTHSRGMAGAVAVLRRERTWLEPLPDAEQQREIDRWAIEDRGIGRDLMERAGAGLADVVQRVAPGRLRGGRAAARATTAGTGKVAARVLSAAGRDVIVLEAPSTTSARSTAPAVIVDALLGTGFAGAPRAPLDGVIARDQRRRRARSSPPTCPAASTAPRARSRADAVRADATATFHAAKPGLWIHPGKAHAGDDPRHRHRHPGGAARRVRRRRA